MDTQLMKNPLAALLSQTWWLLLLRGLVAIAFGLLVCLQPPSVSVFVLVTFFGAFVLVDGIFAVVAAIQGRKNHQDWWIVLLWGLTGVVVGLLTLLIPSAIVALALLYYFAAWVVVTGIVEIIAGVRLSQEMVGKGWLILSGVLSVLFGALLFFHPASGILAMLQLIGIFAVLLGIIFVFLAFRMRKFGKNIESIV